MHINGFDGRSDCDLEGLYFPLENLLMDVDKSCRVKVDVNQLLNWSHPCFPTSQRTVNIYCLIRIPTSLSSGFRVCVWCKSAAIFMFMVCSSSRLKW